MEKNIFLLLIVFVVSSKSNATDQRTEIERKEGNVNQGYDSSVFSTFVPQDAVQQYVSQFGGYSGQALEGFLVPTIQHKSSPAAATSLFSIVRTFFPASKIVLALIFKVITTLVSVLGIFFLGLVLCTFTTVCNTNVPPLTQLSIETKELVSKIGQELTAERVKRAADIFTMAFNKYHEMQKQQS